jgi:hypothetical protein
MTTRHLLHLTFLCRQFRQAIATLSAFERGDCEDISEIKVNRKRFRGAVRAARCESDTLNEEVLFKLNVFSCRPQEL